MDNVFEILPLEAAPNGGLQRVPDTLRLCPDVHSEIPNILGSYSGWALALECTARGCTHRWYVCQSCLKARKRFYTKIQLENHRKNVHHKKKKKATKGTRSAAAVWEDKCQPTPDSKRKRVKTSDEEPSVCRSIDRDLLLQKAAALKGIQITELQQSCLNSLDKRRLSDLILTCEASFEEDVEDEDIIQCQEDVMAVDDDTEVFGEVTTLWVLGTPVAVLGDLRPHAKLGFADQKSERYFINSSLRRVNESGNEAGMNYLVLQSYLQREIAPEELFNLRSQLRKEHVRLQMLISEQVFSMSRTSIDKFAQVLSGTYGIGCEDGYANAVETLNDSYNQAFPTSSLGKNFIKKKMAQAYSESLISRSAQSFTPKMPVSEHDIRVLYSTNKFSILENLPLPPIHTDIEGHAYVSIIECIRHNFAHTGCRVKNIEPLSDNFYQTGIVDALWKCRKAQRIYQIHKDENKEGLVFYLIFWNDDCDPNSAAMQGRANVWVKSMTIAQPSDDNNRMENTYPIAFGEKGISHNAVELKINEELNLLKSTQLDPFYVGALNQHIKATFGVLANIADQPERRAANFLQMGNSTYHARSFVSANSMVFYSNGRLPSCGQCNNKLRNRFDAGSWTMPIEPCMQCLNWDVLQKEGNLALYEIPDGYPPAEKFRDPNTDSHIVVGSDGRSYLECFEITYKGLQRALEIAHEGFTDRGWSKKNCKTFLLTEGINDAFIGEFQKCADRVKVLNDAQGMQREELQEDYETNQHLYRRVPTPAQWVRTGQELSDTIDALMHLIFLGCVKKCMAKIQKCFELKGRNTLFILASQRILKPILVMSVDWLKLRTYDGGKFYGWNSENYLAMARIMPWFYQNVSTHIDVSDPHKDAPPPGKPHTHWTVAENRYWLKVRDLDSTGKKADLVARVADYMSREVVPEPLQISEVKGADIEHLVLTLYHLVCCLMSRRVTESLIKKTDYAVRIFLSAYDDLDRLTRKGGAKPSIVSAYNFLCLLNLPKAMSEFGPLRELWEGKIQGEGGLVFIKPQMTQGKRQNWQSNLLNNVLREKALRSIVNDYQKECRPAGGPFHNDFLRSSSIHYHVYKSALEVVDTIHELNTNRKSAVSVVLVRHLETLRIFSVVHDFDTVLEITGPLELHGQNVTREKAGWLYYRFDIGHDGQTLDWIKGVGAAYEDGNVTIGYGVLLPLLEIEATENNRLFALVSSNWKILGQETNIFEL